MTAVLHGVAINLRLHVNDGSRVGLDPCDIDFDIEVANTIGDIKVGTLAPP